jgi:hypothetical protein
MSTRGARDPNRVYWNRHTTRASRGQLLGNIDTAVVSVVLCNDATLPVRDIYFRRLMSLVPELPAILGTMENRASRRIPKGRGDILCCGGVYTKGDHAGRGFAKALSHWFMHAMAARGYRLINIFSPHPALSSIWENPPAPNTAWVATELDTTHCRPPINLAAVDCRRIFVDLSGGMGGATRSSGLGWAGVDGKRWDSRMRVV